MNADFLREKFLDFFKSKKHEIIESDSLVPKDDPTILFTPAGMNQFKKQFLGYSADFRRSATAQRCLRTDDLDKVGKTTGHHTFFEMLGNFSFGDYFKEEAIVYAWEFLAEKLKIKKERLWVSVYKDDEEAYKIWKNKIGVPQDKIIKLGDKENFWPSEAKEKGPDGPCGPCSEIFFDQGKDLGCKRPDCNPSCNCGRFVEVWNLVFTQFNRKEGGILEPLPKKNIDTGMGLERLAAVMQGVYTNFDTDLFRPIVKEITSNLKPEVLAQKELIYAVADHIRAVAFAIYDGVLPSNETRGYVARKLIRKCTLHLRSLGIRHPFLYRLVPVVSEVMKAPYPQLDKRRENIAEIILAEEKNFISTLNSSDALLKEKFAGLLNKPDSEKAGFIAFQLYDTYGIPLELTKSWLDKHKIKLSENAFNKELQEQKTRSKSQSTMKGDVFDIKGLDLNVKETRFLGYKDYSVQAKIIKIIKDNAAAKKINKDDEARIILDKTVFYPEAGGQVGDTGELSRPNLFITNRDPDSSSRKIVSGKKGRSVFEVLDTQKIDDVIMHIGGVKAGSFKSGDSVSARIDTGRRLSIARNHTATHLLQAGLRKILGVHVQQQGSLVASERLRFDFAHFKDISQDELNRIEGVVNDYIMNNYPLEVKQMSLIEARKSGALAFFAEKYAGRVRVVSISDVSKELCAGTHLDSTGQIGIFKIIQEGSISSGIRRIEAVTAGAAYKMIKEQESTVAQVASVLNVPMGRIAQELEKKIERIKELERQLNSQKLEIMKASLDALVQDSQNIGGIKVIAKIMDDLDMDLLRKAVDLIKQKAENSVIALGSATEGEALLVIGLTEDLCQKGLDASKLIMEMAGIIGGSGGGRNDFAQGGGNKPQNLTVALKKLKDIIKG